MPTASETFAASPRAFLRDNLIVIKDDPGATGIFRFTLKLSTSGICKRPGGSGVAVFELRQATGAGDGFRSYWLPYMNDNAFSLRLGDRADFLFTPTMDGCTFAVGPSTHKLGRIKVAHLNYQKYVDDPVHVDVQNKVIDQPAINAKLQVLFRGRATHILRKSSYKLATDIRGGEGVQLTTVGLRAGDGSWDFVYQKRQIAANPTSWEDFEFSGVTDAASW